MSDIVSKYVRTITVVVAPTPSPASTLTANKPQQKSSLVKQNIVLMALLVSTAAACTWARQAYVTEQSLAVVAYALTHDCQRATHSPATAEQYSCKEAGQRVNLSLEDIQQRSMSSP